MHCISGCILTRMVRMRKRNSLESETWSSSAYNSPSPSLLVAAGSQEELGLYSQKGTVVDGLANCFESRKLAQAQADSEAHSLDAEMLRRLQWTCGVARAGS